jgi:hypothetical protein
VPFLVDGNLETRWTTGAPQDGSEWIEIAFRHPMDVRQITLEMHPRSVRDYPRALAVDAIDEGARVPLFRGSVMTAFGRAFLADPMRLAIDVPLAPHRSTAIRLSQAGRSAGIWWWSIDELVVYGADAAETAETANSSTASRNPAPAAR